MMSSLDLRKSINDDIQQLLLKKRDYVFKMPTKQEGIVFIFSGGIDSTIALGRLLSEVESPIYPLYVKRGARAEKSELKAVHHYVNFFKSRFPNLKELKIIEAEVPPLSIKKHISSVRLETVGHPMRNSVLQAIGVQYAVAVTAKEKLTVHTVMTATSPDDHFSHNSLGAARVMTLMACIDSDDWSWQVTSPLIEPGVWGTMNKASAILYALKNDIPLDKTYTCTQKSDTQCGVCPECICRMEAFKDAGVADPVGYDKNEGKI